MEKSGRIIRRMAAMFVLAFLIVVGIKDTAFAAGNDIVIDMSARDLYIENNSKQSHALEFLQYVGILTPGNNELGESVCKSAETGKELWVIKGYKEASASVGAATRYLVINDISWEDNISESRTDLQALARSKGCIDYFNDLGSFDNIKIIFEYQGAWAKTYSYDANAHWREYTGGSGVYTKNEDKAGYGEHVFTTVVDVQPTYTHGGHLHKECSVCKYRTGEMDLPIIECTTRRVGNNFLLYGEDGQMRATGLFKIQNYYVFFLNGAYYPYNGIVRYGNDYVYLARGIKMNRTGLVPFRGTYVYVENGKYKPVTTVTRLNNKYVLVYKGVFASSYTGYYNYKGYRLKFVKGVFSR